jgi:hypothetical protein
MESNYNKKFDQQVRKKFENFSSEVSPSLWTAIENEIQPNEVSIKKISIIKRYRYFSGAAALLIIGIAFWHVRPVEKIFLTGKGITEVNTVVEEPEIKRSLSAEGAPARAKDDTALAPEAVSKPLSLAVRNEDSDDEQLQVSLLTAENRSENITLRELPITSNALVENDKTVLVEDLSSASVLDNRLAYRSENPDSLDLGQGSEDTEPGF